MPPPPDDVGAQKKAWGRRHYVALSLMYLGYCTNIFGMTSFDVTNTARQLDPVLTLDDVATGFVLSVGSSVYVVGKAIGGPIADGLGGLPSACLSLTVAAAGLVMVSYGRGARSIAAGWGLARLAQAAAWPSIMVLCRQWFSSNGLGTAIGLISTSSRSGAILGSLLLGPLLASRSWRTVLRMAAGVAVCVAGALRLGLRGGGGGGGGAQAALATPTATLTTESKAAPAQEMPISIGRFLRVVATSPRILLLYGVSCFLTPVFQFASLLPLYLTQGLGLSQATAAQCSAVYPLGSYASILITTALWEKLVPKARLIFCSGCMSVAVLSMGALRSASMQAAPAAASGGGLMLSMMLVGVMGGVSPSYYLPTSEHMNIVGGPRSGTLCGWLDLPGYVLATQFFRSYPALLAGGGWAAVFQRLQLYIGVALCCISGFHALELHSPSVGVDPRFVRKQ
jgi:sugar phosphate permease